MFVQTLRNVVMVFETETNVLINIKNDAYTRVYTATINWHEVERSNLPAFTLY